MLMLQGIKSHTCLMKLHFNKMCKHPCSVLKEKGLLVKTQDKELAMYPQCEPLKKQMPEIDILIPGRLDESDRPHLWAKVMEEFEVAQVRHTTIVMVHQLCQKVQELTSGLAGSHQIGSEVYSKLKQGLPLSQ